MQSKLNDYSVCVHPCVRVYVCVCVNVQWGVNGGGIMYFLIDCSGFQQHAFIVPQTVSESNYSQVPVGEVNCFGCHFDSLKITPSAFQLATLALPPQEVARTDGRHTQGCHWLAAVWGRKLSLVMTHKLD